MTESTQHAALAPARRAHVLAVLARDGVVRVSQLIEELGVTPVTLRRDLAQLEDDGLLVRVHGGAVAPEGIHPETGSGPRLDRDPSRGSLAVLVPSLSYYWPGVVAGVEAAAARRGMGVIVRGASYELQDERPVLERLIADENVRGLIVAPNTDTPHAHEVVRWLTECDIPSVLVERDAVLMPEGTPVESVATDHALGAQLAARHLAGLGNRRLGLVLSRFSPTSRKIEAGWAMACTELALAPADHFEHALPDRGSQEFSASVDSTLDTALRMGVTALLVHSDPEAMALADLAMQRGISIPGDLSIIAYDDEVARLFTPQLTAVTPPRTAVGEVAVDVWEARLKDPSRPVQRILLSPTLTIRDSTAPPRLTTS